MWFRLGFALVSFWVGSPLFKASDECTSLRVRWLTHKKGVAAIGDGKSNKTGGHHLTSPLDWADLEGPQIYHLYFCLFAVGPKNTKYHEWDLELVSGADFGCNMH